MNDIKTETLLDLYEAKNSISTLTKIFKATPSYRKPLNASDIELISIVAKGLYVKMRTIFVGWLNFSFKTIFKKMCLLAKRKKKNHNQRTKLKVNSWLEFNALKLPLL